jgi:hypothetical protein
VLVNSSIRHFPGLIVAVVPVFPPVQAYKEIFYSSSFFQEKKFLANNILTESYTSNMPFFQLHHLHANSDDTIPPVIDVEKGPKPEPLLRRSSVYEKPDDPNIVWWDSPNDPENPRNWSTLKKNINVGLISLLCFITPVASAMFAPGIPKVMQDFHNSNDELASFVVSIFVLGFAIGPIILAPLSEIYGRQIIYFIMNVLFVIFTLACAVSSNLGMLIGFRFLAEKRCSHGSLRHWTSSWTGHRPCRRRLSCPG